MFGEILVVCTGNLCRSPMAEAWLRHRLADSAVHVCSAGLAARAGAPADANAVALLSGRGLDISSHRSRQLNESDILGAELVLVMERWQKSEIERRCPAGRGRIFLLAHWQGVEIADPLGGSMAIFEDVFANIDAAIGSWIERIH